MKIITLTLNPAFDVHCSADSFEACHENLATITEREAGGKGVNISRALSMNGVDNLALLAVGDENGAEFCAELDKDSMTYETIELKGRIRENITIHTKNAPETRLSFTGFDTDETLLQKFEEKLIPMLDAGDLVTFTGSVPSGISISAVKGFIANIKNTGAKVVIDSRSFKKDDLIETKPWLIKPNEEEIAVYLNREIDSFESVMDGAKALYESGIENVMISLGSKGALLVCSDGAFIAHPPKINAISTIGAGDSSIGGFLAAAAAGKDSAEMLRTAVSYGSAACMSAGTRPPVASDVADVYAKVTVDKI
ncbi:MAG: 1-phosphofructokinase family hexose kinase [Ruminococcaceae bacterium]|nr:1-phosphofructokinase family hexose kinase [Oscillospiraceae bacterium]